MVKLPEISRCYTIIFMKAITYKNIVGQNIRQIRQKLGLTQEELANMSGLSQGYVNKLESGKRKFTQKTLCAIAEALDLPLYSFFKEEGEENSFRELPDTYAKKHTARDIFKVLKGMPSHIVDHYMTLMSIEKEIYNNNKKPGRNSDLSFLT